MIPLIRYYLLNYFRSYRYFPPVGTYFIFIIVFYTYRPNPAIDSYTVTATALYFISAWICLSFFAIEDRTQQQLTLLHSRSFLKNFAGKIISVFFLSSLLAVYAFLYPLVFGLLDGPLSIKVGCLTFLHHLLGAFMGIALASLFQRDLITSFITSVGGVSLLLLSTLAYPGFVPFIPPKASFIQYIFPPAYAMMNALMNWNGKDLTIPLFLPFIHGAVTIFVVLFFTYYFLSKKRRRL